MRLMNFVNNNGPIINGMTIDNSGVINLKIQVIVPKINPYMICPSAVVGVF